MICAYNSNGIRFCRETSRFVKAHSVDQLAPEFALASVGASIHWVEQRSANGCRSGWETAVRTTVGFALSRAGAHVTCRASERRVGPRAHSSETESGSALAIVGARGHGSGVAVATLSGRIKARSAQVGLALIGGRARISIRAAEGSRFVCALGECGVADAGSAGAPVGARKPECKPGQASLGSWVARRTQRVGALECSSAHLVSPAVESGVRNVVSNGRVSKLVVRGSVYCAANAVGLRTAVPSKEVGSSVSRKGGAVVGLAIDVVQASVPVRSLVLSVVDALPVRALEDAKGARVADVAINFAIASVALDAGRTALAVEANGCAFALGILFALLSVLFQLLNVVGGVDAEPAAAEAHDFDETGLGPRHAVGGAVVHALVVAGEAGVLVAGSAFKEATRRAPGLDVGGAVLVVRNLVERQAALLVRRLGTVRVRASRRVGALAGRVDERVAVEHVQRRPLDGASDFESSTCWSGALFVSL